MIKHPNIDRAVRHGRGRAVGQNQISTKKVGLNKAGKIIAPRSYYTRPIRVASGEVHDKGDVLIPGHTVGEGAYPTSSIRTDKLVF
jgi:hypothetical protein